MDLMEYRGYDQWNIKTNQITRQELYYSCCPEPYIDLTIDIAIERKYTAVKHLLLIPAIGKDYMRKST